MAIGIMGRLVKMGLMNYSQEELDAMTPEKRAAITGTALPVSTSTETIGTEVAIEPEGKVMEIDTVIPEGLDVAEIYTDAGVVPSVYPYEKFVKLVDALAALDDSAKKAALAAMDAADDSWTVGDIASDLVNKRTALIQYQRDIEATVVNLETKANEAIAVTKTESDARVAEMRAQIAALEQSIQDEFHTTGQSIGQLHAQLAANKSAGEREGQRIGAVVSRMTSIEKTYFSAPAV